MTDFNVNEAVARSLTDERLASDLDRIAGNVRFVEPAEREARLREAARRLVSKPPPLQRIVTLDSGHQVALMHGQVFYRAKIGGNWPMPLSQSDTPHQPGTWYLGEW